MTEYVDLPSALGASRDNIETVVKRCDYCGEVFDTIFDEADHILGEGEEQFDPYYMLSGDASIRIGNLMRTFYDNADNAEGIRELAQEIYSILLVAEYNPKILTSELDMMLND